MTSKPPARPKGARLESHGRRAVATPHHLATQAAIDTMNNGGNAVDAAIAANAALGVVAPETCGIGGDLFALVHTPGQHTPEALNSSGKAGARMTGEAARAAGLSDVPAHSHWAVTVPGCVDGWEALANRHGKLGLAELMKPAIALANEGFAVSGELSETLIHFKDTLARQPSANNLYPGGSPPLPGTVVSRPDLGRTLSAIATWGRPAFYEGDVADQIKTATQGLLDHTDLAAVQAEWIEPISLEIMGWTGWTIPPNSQGYLALAAAWIFEQLDPPHDPEDPRFTHAAIEAYRSVAWERDHVVSDGATASQPNSWLLDVVRLQDKVERLSLGSRAEWPAPSSAPGGTAYLCARDEDGVGISLIQSNFHGIGSDIGVGTSGFFLHDRGSGFSLEPGHANELGPGKRPLHTLSPTLWTEGDSLAMLLGTRGGHFQPQTLLQMITHLRWAGNNGAAAQLLPRWTTQEWRNVYTGVAHEPHLPAEVVDGLRRLGHRPQAGPGWMPDWGPVSVITNERDGAHGAADPRVPTTAAMA